MDLPLRSPVLVGAWPGMGGVAQIAGIHLVKQLGAQPIEELDPRPFFEPQGVAVQGGLIQPMALPRSVFYGWRDPQGAQDLLVLLCDQQPAAGVRRYVDALLEIALRHGVSRVFTFAAMASQLEVGGPARVFAAATSAEFVERMRADGVTLLEAGDITGMNGVFLGAAAERGLHGACLLGEFPFVAANLPNPRASAAILAAFSRYAGIALDTEELLGEARRVEDALAKHMRAAGKAQATPENGGEGGNGEITAADETVDADERARIEELFAAATKDRTKAMQLKAELDRLGRFHEYEDRFLDLFRKAG